MAIGIGRRITSIATRCQIPSPTGFGSRCRKTRKESTRCPSTASSAGSTTTAPSAASTDTATPAYANERRNDSGKSHSARSETATVSALPATVRPAVDTVRTTASSVDSPFRSSSRNRETTNKL